MTTEYLLKAVLSESRNGMNHAVQAGLYPMLMSDGAQEACEAAQCYWLMDILGTELAPKLQKDINNGECGSAYIRVLAKDAQATIEASVEDGAVYWSRKIEFTTFPDGDWTLFEMGPADWDNDGRTTKMICCLLSEH